MYLRGRNLLVSGAAGVLAGCFPVLSLPARIESGSQLGLVAAMQAVSVHPRHAPDSVPSTLRGAVHAGGHVAFGRAADKGVGFRLAGFAHLGAGAGADVYLQLPSAVTTPWAVGGGVLGQGGAQPLWGPYVLVGRKIGAETELWVRQGMIWLDGPREAWHQRLSATTAGYRWGRGTGHTTVLVGAVLGAQDTRCQIVSSLSCRPYTRAYIGLAEEMPAIWPGAGTRRRR